MAKIVIPPIFIDTRSNKLSIPISFEQSIKKKPIASFNNPKNTYVLNLKPRSNEINEYASGCLGYLNIEGGLEINSTANLRIDTKYWPFKKILEESDGWEPSLNICSTYRSSGDDWRFNELTINNTQPNGFIDLNYKGSSENYIDEQNNVEEYKNKYLKKLSLKADAIALEFSGCDNLESVTVDCKSTTHLRINGKNIKEIVLPRLTFLDARTTFVSSRFKDSLPLDPIIKINKDCIFDYNFHCYSGIDNSSINHEEQKSLLDILNEENAQFNIENNLLEIKLSDLQKSLSKFEIHTIQKDLNIKLEKIEKPVEIKIQEKEKIKQK